MEETVLDMRRVAISYGDDPVVHDFSLSVAPGEILGIVGESGSGKSTVIRSVMGLLEGNGTVTQGEIYYKGQNLLACSKEEWRKLRGNQIGMIFQNAGASFCPVRRIEEQIYESVQQHEKIGKKEIRKRVLELSSQLGLKNGEQILKSYPFELSGGMSQRVGILMAMFLRPQLLLADEPTSALDVVVQKQVIDELLKMRQMYQTSMVIVTHNIGVVRYMADTVAVMHQGKLIEYGKKQEVLENPKEEYTKRLLQSVPRIIRG